jgi:hypothetical protein
MYLTKTLAAAAVVLALGAGSAAPALAFCNATVVVRNDSNETVRTSTVENQKKGEYGWTRMEGNQVYGRTLQPGESVTITPKPMFRKPEATLRWRIKIVEDSGREGYAISNYGWCKSTVSAYYTGS